WAKIAGRGIGDPGDFQCRFQIHFPPNDGVGVPTGVGDGTSAPGLVGVPVSGPRGNGITQSANLAGHAEYGSVRMRTDEGACQRYLRLASRGCAGQRISDAQLVKSRIRFDDIPKREGDLFAAAQVPSVRERNTILAPLVEVRTARDRRRERIGRARQHYEIRWLDVNMRGNVLDGEHPESEGTKR